MLDVIGVVKLLIKEPLMTVLGIVVGCVVYLSIWAISTDVAMAEMQVRQSIDEGHYEGYKEMHDMLIRIDENVKILKDSK